MEKLRWSEEKPDKVGMWAGSLKSKARLEQFHEIDILIPHPDQAPIGDEYYWCYCGPIPVIAPPAVYRQPIGEVDVSKTVECLRTEMKYNLNKVIEKWEKNYKIIGYKTAYGKSEYLIRPPLYGNDFWASPDIVRILE